MRPCIAKPKDTELICVENKIRHALSLHIPYESKLTIKGVKAAVLIAIQGEDLNRAKILFTQRTTRVEKHKGQVAFPGGVTDPEDFRDTSAQTAIATALRETHEEVGILPDQLHVYGTMPKLQTVTAYEVIPVVAKVTVPEISLAINQDEIDNVFWLSFQELLAPGVYRRETIQLGGFKVTTHVFQVGTHRVWGVTAAILKNLIVRLGMLK